MSVCPPLFEIDSTFSGNHRVPDAPQFLVEWSSPWQEFVSAVGPALRRSPPPLGMETRAGLFPWRGILVVSVLEIAAVLATAIARPAESGKSTVEELPPTHDVIFFSAEELPRTEDLGGAPAGVAGKKGGESAYHAVQTIRVAREQIARERVIDAPQLKLPKSDSQIRNLLAFKADAGLAPVEALKPPKQPVPEPPVRELQADQLHRPKRAVPKAATSPDPAQIEAPRIVVPRRQSALHSFPISAAVVPPPVSAPVQPPSQPARITLPPAPRTEVNLETRSRLENDELQPRVVPAPVEASPATTAAPSSVANAQAAAQTTSSSSAVIVSPRPGEKPAQPANPEKAMIAMSPAGTGAAGSGTEGIGSGTGRGVGFGSSASAAGPGAASAGAGKRADASPRPGNSPYPGPGGAGDRTNGSPRVPGVSISGGSNVVRLPSFGPAPVPSAAGRSSTRAGSNAITVVASPRAGGAMNLYGALKGDRVYTIYINTSIGHASMQFADPSSAAHPYADELKAPVPILTGLPADLAHDKLVVRYVLDRNGALRNPQVLHTGSRDFESKVLAALANWKFSPALRGNDAVEVNVILGFGVDTK